MYKEFDETEQRFVDMIEQYRQAELANRNLVHHYQVGLRWYQSRKYDYKCRICGKPIAACDSTIHYNHYKCERQQEKDLSLAAAVLLS